MDSMQLKSTDLIPAVRFPFLNIFIESSRITDHIWFIYDQVTEDSLIQNYNIVLCTISLLMSNVTGYVAVATDSLHLPKSTTASLLLHSGQVSNPCVHLWMIIEQKTLQEVPLYSSKIDKQEKTPKMHLTPTIHLALWQ